MCSTAMVSCVGGVPRARVARVMGRRLPQSLLPRPPHLTPPPPRAALITSYGRAGRCEEALRVLDAMRSAAAHPDRELPFPAPDAISFSAALSAFERADRWRDALRLMQKMRRDGMTPSVWGFNAAIAACQRGGAWLEALSLFEEMRARGVSPDEVTYGSLIVSLERGGQTDLIDAFYRQGVADGVLSHASVHGKGFVDLHGFSIPMAKAAVRTVLHDVHLLYTAPEQGKDARVLVDMAEATVAECIDPFADLTVITGAGRHSPDGMPVIQAPVRQMLACFVPPIPTVVRKENAGRVVIKARDISEWVERQVDVCGRQRQ